MVRDPDSGKYGRTRLFVLTLGYSRKSVRLLVRRSSAQVWAELHERAFRRLGGTVRVVVLDNPKEGVLALDIYDPTLNPLYRDVLTHYGVVALPCRVRVPEREGKIEAGVGRTKRTPLRSPRFVDLDDAQTHLDRWERRWADTRIHGTTKHQVAAMLAEERPALGPSRSSRSATTSTATAPCMWTASSRSRPPTTGRRRVGSAVAAMSSGTQPTCGCSVNATSAPLSSGFLPRPAGAQASLAARDPATTRQRLNPARRSAAAPSGSRGRSPARLCVHKGYCWLLTTVVVRSQLLFSRSLRPTASSSPPGSPSSPAWIFAFADPARSLGPDVRALVRAGPVCDVDAAALAALVRDGQFADVPVVRTPGHRHARACRRSCGTDLR